MNLNSKQASFTIPVFCKDQAADIQIIEATANKALQNIHNLYNEIMTPKANHDVCYEASVKEYSSDSTLISLDEKNDDSSSVSVPKLLHGDLCSKCQKLVSTCSSPKSCCFLQNQHQPPIINKFFRANSNPQVKPFRRHSYHPDRKDSHFQDQHALGNTSQATKESHSQEKCAQRIPDSPREIRINSQDQIQESSHNLREVKKQRKLSLTISEEDQNVKKHPERKNSYYTESNSEYNNYLNYTFKSLKQSRMQFCITVPKPFSLTAENEKRQLAKEEKITKLREEINSQIEKELKVRFSPRPVPKHVQLPLYGEMVKLNEKRKKERKDKCIEILNKNIKPFNLSSSSRTCASKSVSDLPQDESKAFKAKPVPKNILSENISQRIKNKEELRKLLIAQRAEEMLHKSSSPFSPKPIHRSLSLFNISDSKNKSNVDVTKEKIEAITNRLYSIKCQEAIENWNEKVLQNDFQNPNCYKKCNQDKKVHKSALPFQNFPVRKTTATFLRDKQIRADIEMRKMREEMNESIEEEMSRNRKEILKNIWPRLKSAEQIFDIGKEIEDKVKNHRKSQKNREQEYEKELEDMMRRVSNQFLLIERQSKELRGKMDKSGVEVSSNKDESDSLANVESAASDTPTQSASEKSNPSTPSASKKSDSPTPSDSEKSSEST